MIKKQLILLAAVILLIGCSQTPKPVAYTFSTQKKIQASEHWEILAKDVRKGILNKLDPPAASGTTVNFLPNNTSAFCRGFRSFLATELIHSGFAPAPADIAQYTVDWSVQAVAHKERRVSENYPTNTLVAALGYGVYKLIDSNSSSVLGTIGTGLALDVAEKLYQINSVSLPQNEIILTVSLKKGDIFVYRSTNIYYVNDMDIAHYYTTKDSIGMDKSFNTKTFDVSN